MVLSPSPDRLASGSTCFGVREGSAQAWQLQSGEERKKHSSQDQGNNSENSQSNFMLSSFPTHCLRFMGIIFTASLVAGYLLAEICGQFGYPGDPEMFIWMVSVLATVALSLWAIQSLPRKAGREGSSAV